MSTTQTGTESNQPKSNEAEFITLLAQVKPEDREDVLRELTACVTH